MSGYLLDTNVLSQLAPGREGVHPALVAWLSDDAKAERMYVSAISIMEIRSGIARLRRKGGERRAELLAGWLEELMTVFSDRILVVDSATALIAGDLNDAAIAQGRPTGLADVVIAATARTRGLTVVTSNIKHFEHLGVDVERPASEAEH